MTINRALDQWIQEMAQLTKPDRIIWIDGSEGEKSRLTQEALATGELIELNHEKLPGCYLHRSAQNDVARVEHLTFICTDKREDAGPNNNWMSPEDAYTKLGRLFDGSMLGRTMYVIPYSMGPIGSPFSKIGIELTDSIYVVLNMRIMTRIGQAVLDQLGDSPEFVKGLHSKGDLDPEKRFICHFPEDNAIWSVGSGYGGNVLLGKKCLALRIASYRGRFEGWLAEHMLILGLEDPQGNVSYIAGAFPSACGKTNLAMLVPPETIKGCKVWTVGDDIAWIRIGEDGRLWAVNPEAGMFGVAPGTSPRTNPNALAAVQRNTIFTNVLMTPQRTVWWEGLGEAPEEGIDWKGNPWTPDNGEKGAHPNSRFTAPLSQVSCISREWESPQGVPLSAIIFGGRRARTAPLVYQSFDWAHGVFIGATMASETTAAATGAIGVIRRDPMAMLPFCGYNMGDYFAHWLEMGRRTPNPPKIFHVNWFRTDDNGKFLWPGFGENLRVLNWIVERCRASGAAVESPIGWLPADGAIDTTGLDISPDAVRSLFEVDREAWAADLADQARFFEQFGDRLPAEIRRQWEGLKGRLGA